MIKLSLIIEETRAGVNPAFCNDSRNPTPLEIKVLEQQLKTGGFGGFQEMLKEVANSVVAQACQKK